MAYRTSVQESIGVSPCKMMFGREINLPIDMAMGKPAEEMYSSQTDYAYQLENKLVKIHEFARVHLDMASLNMKKNYDRGTNLKLYDKGDAVWYHDPRRTKGKNPKLQRNWKGPMIVIKRINDVLYRIKEGPRFHPKVVHHDRLKPYKGENKPIWFEN